MLSDAELTLDLIATLDRWHLVRLRNAAQREEALLPRYKLQAGGPWNEDIAVRRMKLVMAIADCEARLAGRKLVGSRARRDWHTSQMGQAEYLA